MNRFCLYMMMIVTVLLPAAGFPQEPTPRPLPPGVQISAKVEPSSVVVGDSIQYTIQVMGNVTPEQMQSPNFSRNTKLELLDGPATMSSLSVINGRSTMSTSYSYRLRTTEVGEQEIPPSRFLINGIWYDTNSVNFTVREAPQRPEGMEGVISARSRDNAQLNQALHWKYFAMAEVPEDIYRGQAVPMTIYIYRAPQLASFIQARRVSNAAGRDFVTIQNTIDTHQQKWEEASIGGQKFLRTPLYTTFVVPTRAGQLRLDPPKTLLDLPLEQRQPRRIEDLYSMGPSFATVECDIRAMTVNVQELPAKPDAALLQVVGDVTQEVSVDRETLQERELLTLTVSLQGEAYLEMLSAPDIPNLSGLALLNKSSRKAEGTRGGKYLSKRDFEYVFQATRAGEVEIPAIPVAVFNPQTGGQQIISNEPIQVTIQPSSANAVLLGGAATDEAGSPIAARERAEAQVIGADVAYIDASRLTGAMISPRKAFYLQPWYWFLQLIPLGVAVAFGVIGLRAKRGKVESASARTKRARQSATRALKEARSKLETGSRDDFYSTLSGGIMGYVATLIGRSPGGLTAEDACDGLQNQGLPEENCERLKRVLRNCDTIRYSPAPDTREAREAAVREAEELLVQLGEGGKQ